ncbi:MAG TPA: ANTAR domain-containing protein, partial [Steroidobacteraceae bacterium]
KHLVAAQERAFRIFSEFAGETAAATFRQLTESEDTLQLHRHRNSAYACEEMPDVGAVEWYELATRRIDVMKVIEDAVSSELERLCLDTLHRMQGAPVAGLPPSQVAMLITDIEASAPLLALHSRPSMFAAEEELPQTLHSIRAVVEAQSRRIDTMNSELESTRQALAERKLIERAKGILMQQRHLSERDAYELMRQTAMRQNKRLIEIATAVASMADLFKG